MTKRNTAMFRELFQPQVAVVDFHHARGPEIEFWISPAGEALYQANDWGLLPFMALSDGVHAMVEDFSYFTLLSRAATLRKPASKPEPLPTQSLDSMVEVKLSDDDDSSQSRPRSQSLTVKEKVEIGLGDSSLFGIACTRQIRSDRLKRRSASVTRSSVQKAVVVLTDNAQGLGELRTRLGAVTQAWFAQEDFSDRTILKDFQDSLARTSAWQPQEEGEHYFGLSLREMIHEFRHQTLVLVKCLFLQRKMLFFGSKCERLCMLQFALLSLIPGLTRNLQDSAHPALDTYSLTATRAASLRTSERSSLLAYMGLPVHIFGKGAFFGPYTPLQHLDVLADYDTKSYMVGSTNSLLLQQKERYADILINLDEQNSITILSPSLRAALALSAADRRWIDYLTQTVLDTWDPDNPSRPKNMGYAGSEEAIRLQFEEYVLSLLSCMAYQSWYELAHPVENDEVVTEPKDSTNSTSTSTSNPKQTTSPPSSSDSPDPAANASDFNPSFLAAWHPTNNHRLFNTLTATLNPPIWHITPAQHPTAGALGVEDVQRRLQQSMRELGLDERVREGRETLSRTLEIGRERVRDGVGRFWGVVQERRTVWDPNNRSSSSLHSNSNRNSMALENEHTTPTSTANTTTTANNAVPPTSTSTITDPAATDNNDSNTTSSWPSISTLRDRASKVQLTKPDTTQLQHQAKENAARAGAYLSSWGSWARERGGRVWSDGSGGGTGAGAGAGAGGGGGEAR